MENKMTAFSPHTYIRFAETYSEGAYGGCTYNNGCTVQGNGTGSGAASPGKLTDTGVAIVAILH